MATYGLSTTDKIHMAEKLAEFTRAVAERFPEARFHEGRWYANVRLDECKLEPFVGVGPWGGSDDSPKVRFYVDVGGGRVYAERLAYIGTALEKFRQQNPDGYASLVKVAAGS
jgi:hypothetical protein